MASQNRRGTRGHAGSGAFGLLRRLSLAAAASLAIATAPGDSRAAMVDWLVLLIDASESIDVHEYRLQREAYINVLRDPDIGLLLAGARVAIVEFATAPQVVVAWADSPTHAARAYARHTRGIRGPGPASLTGIARALELALDLLEGKAGRRVIEISGDGPENVDWFAGVWSQRERARRMRIEINGPAIPTPEEPNIILYYGENVITGFLEVSREPVDFERALLTKMHIEIAGSVAK